MGSADYEGTLAALAGIALPDVGAWSIVDLVEPSGEIRRLAIVHPDPAMQRLARRLQDGWPPNKDDPMGTPVVMRTGKPQILTHVDDEMLIKVARSAETHQVRVLRSRYGYPSPPRRSRMPGGRCSCASEGITRDWAWAFMLAHRPLRPGRHGGDRV